MRDPTVGYERGIVAGAVSLSIFTFLLLTPTGWLTMYLVGTGGVRAGAAWFDDPVGDPILTGHRPPDRGGPRAAAQRPGAAHARGARRSRDPRSRRQRRQGGDPRLRSRRRVVTAQARVGARGGRLHRQVYRIGEPVERTIAGQLRTLYPLTEHTDLEVVRKSVHYDMPDAHPRGRRRSQGRQLHPDAASSRKATPSTCCTTAATPASRRAPSTTTPSSST